MKTITTDEVVIIKRKIEITNGNLERKGYREDSDMMVEYLSTVPSSTDTANTMAGHGTSLPLTS